MIYQQHASGHNIWFLGVEKDMKYFHSLHLAEQSWAELLAPKKTQVFLARICISAAGVLHSLPGVLVLGSTGFPWTCLAEAAEEACCSPQAQKGDGASSCAVQPVPCMSPLWHCVGPARTSRICPVLLKYTQIFLLLLNSVVFLKINFCYVVGQRMNVAPVWLRIWEDSILTPCRSCYLLCQKCSSILFLKWITMVTMVSGKQRSLIAESLE